MARSPCSNCLTITGVLNGDDGVTAGRIATATLRVGGNGGAEWGYQLDADGTQVQGGVLWDPSHAAANDAFSSVASVRLHVSRVPANAPTQLKIEWSVGTLPFLTRTFDFDAATMINSVRVFAQLTAGALSSALQWNYINFQIRENPDDSWEPLISPATPAAIRTGVPVRNADPTDAVPFGAAVFQLAHFRFPMGVYEMRLCGQVTLQANLVHGWEGKLDQNSIMGGIRLFSDELAAEEVSLMASAARTTSKRPIGQSLSTTPLRPKPDVS